MSANEQHRRRRRPGRVWVALLLLAGAGAAGGWAWVEKPWQKRPQKVAVERVALRPATQVLAVNGRVAAERSVAISPTVAAQVLDVLVDEGDSVTAGQVLARLDAARAQALLGQAEAAYGTGLARQEQAQTEVDRARALGENTPRKTLVDAELALATVRNEVAQLAAALEEVRSQLSQYTITAPLAGVVLARSVEPGQVVDAQTQLFTVADLAQLVVETDVDELYSARISVGLPTLLRAVGETLSRPGTVAFTSPRVDASTGGRAIRVSFDEPVTLPVGLTVAVNIIVSEEPEALTVPRGAIVSAGLASRVLLLEDGEVVEREVTIRDWPAERVIVSDGLAAGDAVILDPSTVRPGASVVAAN